MEMMEKMGEDDFADKGLDTSGLIPTRNKRVQTWIDDVDYEQCGETIQMEDQALDEPPTVRFAEESTVFDSDSRIPSVNLISGFEPEFPMPERQLSESALLVQV
jgi:hypothetical protein